MYSEYIQSLIKRICNQPRTFEFISKNVSGLDPIRLKEILKDLETRKVLSKNQNLWSLVKSKHSNKIQPAQDSQYYLRKFMGYFDFLKTPHPLDFEWRNSTASLNHLISELQKINSIHDQVLLLGMPTLFATALTLDIPQSVTLIERNAPIVKSLSNLCKTKKRFKIIDADIFKVNPSNIGKFFSVCLDPPWYSPYFYHFIWLAAQCVEVGGIVSVILPPINTRPNIADERLKWFSYCNKQGLSLENLESQKLDYAMPFFEFNAFRSAGVEDILPFWRKGDLAYFRKIENFTSKRPTFIEQNTNWIEVEIDNVRIRVILNEEVDTKEKLEILPIIKGDILPSVSLRDKRRKQANMWTSGNRIFNVNNPKKFIELLSDYKNKKKGLKDSNTISNFLNSVVQLEKKEYNNYLDWLYYEMERQSS